MRSACVDPDKGCTYNCEKKAPLAHPLDDPWHSHAGSARRFTCLSVPWARRS